MIVPLARPQIRPVSNPPMSATSAGSPQSLTMEPAMIPANARIEPIDRSKAPPISRIIMPTVRIPVWAESSSTAAKFGKRGNVAG